MKIQISDFAHKELEEAIYFYELEQQGLGRRFKKEIQKAIDRIIKYPKAWPFERSGIRKCLVHKFPYKYYILYNLPTSSFLQ